MNELTTLLEGARQGDRTAIDGLVAGLYQEFRHLAHSRLRQSGPITLDTTALVHESYLRLVKAGKLAVNDRSHFMTYAARVMRSIIVDLIRQRRAERHGGDQICVTLNTDIAEFVQAGEEQILRLNDALETLGKVDERLLHVVELRYFAGLSEQEIAACLGVTERTVRRDWAKARMLLAAALS